jgi:hypothetical protein
VAVPHLGAILPALAGKARVDVCFRPAWPLAGAPFHAAVRPTGPLLRHAESIC